MTFKAYFDIHGLINLEFVSDRLLALKYVSEKYGQFIANNRKDLDLRFNISVLSKNGNGGSVKKNGTGMFHEGFRHLAKWKSEIIDLDKKPTIVNFYGNILSIKYLLMWIVEPLINIKLNLYDAILLHASGVSFNGKAFVFCSRPGGGKTSLALKLMDNPSIEFLSDEFVIVTQDGRILPFLMPTAFYDYNFQLNTKLNNYLSNIDKMNLKIKKFIRILSKDKVKIPTHIDIRRHLPNNIQSGSCELKKFFVLSKTAARHFEFQERNFSSFVRDILKINNYQFRYFNNLLQNENPPYVHVLLDSWQTKQKKILGKALSSSVFLDLRIPSDLSGRESEIAALV